MNRFDLAITSFINGFAHRSVRFDEFVIWISISNLLKGMVVTSLIWWLWFQGGDIRKRREALLAGIIASFPALALSRILSWIFFRPRPLTETRLVIHVPYGANAAEWQQISSFPSDHAVFFFALATGIFFAYRRLGWFAYLYISVMICLPRIFIGEHYATDILTGAAIGTCFAWVANLPNIRRPLTRWVLQLHDARPAMFYCFFFILTCEMAEVFESVIYMYRYAKAILHGQAI
jgi:undecaprenyl-diphosphatase